MSETSNQSPSAGRLITVGQRKIFYFNDNGQPAYQVYDLTLEDFLNPQPGDEFYHGQLHDRSARILASMVHHHYRYSPTISVHIRPKLIWPDTTLDQPMPDVVVVNNLYEPQRQRPAIDLAAEQASSADGEVAVRAIFEVTSPQFVEAALETKRALYARAGVPEYWIIDTGLRPDNEQPHFTILGYQLQDGAYQPIAPISENRWESKACRLCLTINADRQSFQIGDLRTGSAYPIPAEDDDPSIATQAEANRRAQSIANQLKL